MTLIYRGISFVFSWLHSLPYDGCCTLDVQGIGILVLGNLIYMTSWFHCGINEGCKVGIIFFLVFFFLQEYSWRSIPDYPCQRKNWNLERRSQSLLQSQHQLHWRNFRNCDQGMLVNKYFSFKKWVITKMMLASVGTVIEFSLLNANCW